jgi:hypothetical protein
MPPSADAFPGRTGRDQPDSMRTERDRPQSTSGGVPPPRSAPEVESTASGSLPPGTGPAGTGAEPDGPPTGTADHTGPDDTGDTPGPGDAPGAGGAADGLTGRELRILAFERHWWRHAGAKEQAIRDTFGLSATRYYQLLNALLDNPAALAADPLLVGRLRRLRSSRARNRRR